MRTCPLGHRCPDCLWSVRLRGKDPTSEQEIDDERCAIAWLPILLVENSQQQRQTAAAVEMTRNVIAGQGSQIAETIMYLAGQAAQGALTDESK